jgi:enterochelin esterase family protein
MKIILDNLIDAGKLAKIIAFTHPGERPTEYPDDPDHRWITDELLPTGGWFSAADRTGRRCLMGTSFGPAALATAVGPTYGSPLRSHHFFSDPDVCGTGVRPDRFIDQYRAHPVRPADRVFLSCGAYEDLVEANRGMLPIFRSVGMKINYVESRDGHSWGSWRDQLGPGLCWLFPGDLAP